MLCSKFTILVAERIKNKNKKMRERYQIPNVNGKEKKKRNCEESIHSDVENLDERKTLKRKVPCMP